MRCALNGMVSSNLTPACLRSLSISAQESTRAHAHTQRELADIIERACPNPPRCPRPCTRSCHATHPSRGSPHRDARNALYMLLRPPMSLRDPSRSWSVLSAMRGGVDDRGCTYERMVYRPRVVALSHAPKLGARGQSPHHPPAAWVHMRPCAHDPECGHGARVVYMRLA